MGNYHALILFTSDRRPDEAFVAYAKARNKIT